MRRPLLSALASALAALLLAAAPAEAQRVSPGGERAQRALRTGIASYYHPSLHGNRTANGERYNHGGISVAHRSLPFGTLLRVSHARTGRAVLVRVNDRGPFVRGRVLDLSGGAARAIGAGGLTRVRWEVVDRRTLPSRQPAPAPKVKHI